MSERPVVLSPEGVSAFIEQMEEKFRDENKTEWSKFVRKLLTRNQTPTLEKFFRTQKSTALDS